MPMILQQNSGLPAVRFDEGTELLTEGQTTGRLYILVDGEVEVRRGDTRVMVANTPGAIFGEMSILLETPHTASVRTLSSSTMYVIEDAGTFLEAHPEIALVIARLLAQRLNAATTYLVDLKQQFEGSGDHMAMVGEVLETLIHDQRDEFRPGSDLETAGSVDPRI